MTKKRNTEANGRPSSSRRSFLLKFWFGLGLVALAELVWVAVTFLRSRKIRKRRSTAGSLVEAGPVESFARDSVTAFPRGQFYLVRTDAGGFLALHRRCTHLGCTVPWDPEKKRFLCPCHSSAFDIRGEAVRQPATRALDLFPVAIENNRVRVNTDRPIKRSGFNPKQVVFPEKLS
jgi:Rieske Fe-S protein